MHCGPDEESCDMGTWDGCPMGNYCMNTEYDPCGCPPATVQCGPEEMMCDSGYDAAGCYMGNYCTDDPCGCPTTCGPNEMLCDMGTSPDGCLMGSYCTDHHCGCPPAPVECGP